MKILKDKRIITGIAIVLFILFGLLMTGCEVIDGQPSEVTKNEEEKPLTKQVCDYFGYSSASIIREQAEQGYVFTGKTRGFFCNNLLNFQLKGE